MEETTIKVRGFQCEICDRKFFHEWDAENCEKRHSCKHESVKYEVSYGMDTELSKECTHCHETIAIVYGICGEAYNFLQDHSSNQEELAYSFEKLQFMGCELAVY